MRTPSVTTLERQGQEFAEAERVAVEYWRLFALVGPVSPKKPPYAGGTAIVVRERSDRTLRAGMAVVYRNERKFCVAHRLVDNPAAGRIATGLNNARPDRELVLAENSIGAVQAALLRRTRALGPKSRRGWCASKAWIGVPGWPGLSDRVRPGGVTRVLALATWANHERENFPSTP